MEDNTIKQERKVIQTKGARVKYELEFFLSIQEAVLGGWRVAETNLRDDSSLRNFRGNIGKVVLYKGALGAPESPVESKEPLEVQPPSEEPAEAPAAPEELSEAPVAETPEDDRPEGTSPSEELNGLSKKVELYAFAEKHGFTVPEDVTKPAAIKKFLKGKLAE
jgi:hypothetical protein